jgi:hypothetical protein
MDDEKYQLSANKFSGKQTDFVMWAARFMSYAPSKGFDDILYGYKNMIIPSKDEELDKKEDATLIVIHKMNGLAMSALYSACRDPVSFNASNNAISEEIPQGNAHQAWLNLHTIFKPASSAQKHDLEFQFTQCSLIHDTKNPDEWFTELGCIRLQLQMDHKVKYDDEKMITQIIYNILPPAYQTTVEYFTRDLNRQVSATLFQVQEDIRQIYGQLQQNQHFGRQHHSKSRIPFHQNDSLLATFPKKTKSLCRICGKMGHKTADCWDHPNNKDKPRPSRFQKRNDTSRPIRTNFRPNQTQTASATTTTAAPKLTCTYCHRDNHIEANCFKKQADRRNKSGHNPNKTADVILVAAPRELGPATTHKISATILIGDSGATCHMGYSSSGMFDLIPCQTAVTVGNNETMYSQAKGSFKGTVHNTYGTSFPLILTDVL